MTNSNRIIIQIKLTNYLINACYAKSKLQGTDEKNLTYGTLELRMFDEKRIFFFLTVEFNFNEMFISCHFLKTAIIPTSPTVHSSSFFLCERSNFGTDTSTRLHHQQQHRLLYTPQSPKYKASSECVCVCVSESVCV